MQDESNIIDIASYDRNNKPKKEPDEPSQVIDVNLKLAEKQYEESIKSWAKEFIEAIESHQEQWKTKQISPRELEMRFLEELKEDLVLYEKDFRTILDSIRTTKSVLDRKVLWKKLKLIREKITGVKRGIEVKRNNLKKL